MLFVWSKGFILALSLLANRLDDVRHQNMIRLSAAVVAIALFAYSFYYVAVVIKPDKSYLSYWEANDDV